MGISVTLTLEQWNFILEVIDLNSTTVIKSTAINILRPKIEEEYKEQLNQK